MKKNQYLSFLFFQLGLIFDDPVSFGSTSDEWRSAEAAIAHSFFRSSEFSNEGDFFGRGL